MEWHYTEDGRQIGPIKGSEFQMLVESGRITSDTLVWHEGMGDWQPYAKAIAGPAGSASLPKGSGEESNCCECGRPFRRNEMMNHGEAWVCAECKPVFIQRLQEGGDLPGVMQYGGFWIRFGAKFIDGLILQPINFVMGLLGAMIGSSFKSPGAALATQGIIMMLCH